MSSYSKFTTNDWRVLFDVKYAYDTAPQQAIIEELRGLREALEASNNNLSSDLAVAIIQALSKIG